MVIQIEVTHPSGEKGKGIFWQAKPELANYWRDESRVRYRILSRTSNTPETKWKPEPWVKL